MENLAEFEKLYGFSNLEDKVVFDDGGSVGPAQLTSPIPLEVGDIFSNVNGWLGKEARREMTSLKEPSLENQSGDSGTSREGDEARARGTRARVRPRWLEEFVRLEAL